MKKLLSMSLSISLLLSSASCGLKSKETSESTSIATTGTSASQTVTTTETTEETKGKYEQYATMTPEEIVSKLTLEQKTAQMVTPLANEIDADSMLANCYGTIYADSGTIDSYSWRELVDELQQAAISSDAAIPFLFASDAAHGVGYCLNAVYFPHNIGIGAANDELLAQMVGLNTANEAGLCHMTWNLYPDVSLSIDPREGRNYRSYGSDPELVTRLSTAYTKGLLDGGMLACARIHLDEENQELAKTYQSQIDAGLQTILINSEKMDGHSDAIRKFKEEMGFSGIIAFENTDSEASALRFDEQIILGINSGIDMIFNGEKYADIQKVLIDAIKSGKISEERINDAVTRIIKVKKDAGLFEDPLGVNRPSGITEEGSAEFRSVARLLVSQSLVLLKNENEILPLKEGTKVYLTGPAATDERAQCSGFTLNRVKSSVSIIPGVETIKEAFEKYAEGYGIELVTDPQNADVVVLCVGEKSYADTKGDTEDLELCGNCGLSDNRKAIDEAATLGKPTVTCIIAGRHVLLDETDLKKWNSVVMCYLPGSEGKGITDVLCGCAGFAGKLPEPWYGSIDQIGTDQCLFETGYGLTYPEDFVPRQAPEAEYDAPIHYLDLTIMQGTNFRKGKFENGEYYSTYGDLKIKIPKEYLRLDEEMKSNYQKEWSSQGEALDDAYLTGDQASAVIITYANTDRIKNLDPNVDYGEIDIDTFFDLKCKFLGKDRSEGKEEQVVLGGKEYTRIIEPTKNANGEDLYTYFYARKIEKNVILYVQLYDKAGVKHEDDYYDSWFVE